MDADRTALPVRIIDENLKLLDSEASSAVERRLAQLSDLATYISNNSSKLLDPDDRMGGLEGLFSKGMIPAEAVDEAVPYLEAYYSSQLLSDKLTVCKFLADRLGWRNDFRLASLLGADSEGFVPLGNDPKISYLKNAFADEAFLAFAKLLGNPSVDYQSDFQSVCEEVYYGRADMCILPVDSSRDAKLIGFCRLIDKYELKIVLACDIVSNDGGLTTRYALLRKTLTFPEVLPPLCDARLLELSFVPTEGISLADVLTAASRFGLALYKVDAIPLTYSDNEFSYDVILHCPDRAVEPFALFMALAAPQYSTLGVYAHIKS